MLGYVMLVVLHVKQVPNTFVCSLQHVEGTDRVDSLNPVKTTNNFGCIINFSVLAGNLMLFKACYIAT